MIFRVIYYNITNIVKVTRIAYHDTIHRKIDNVTAPWSVTEMAGYFSGFDRSLVCDAHLICRMLIYDM